MDAGLALVAGGFSASQQMSAGRVADYEGKTEAKRIETAATAREADRKEKLARAMASQNAAVGGKGVTFQGSPLSVLEEDIKRESQATERDALMTRIAAGAARTRGKVAKSQAKGAAFVSLLTGASQSATLSEKE